MTMFEPNLQLRKLRIMAGAQSVYFGNFHEGVNIISGHNASGKSTIMDFIFYVLGGEGVPWKNEALLCSDVLAQLSLNGRAVTIKRAVNSEPRTPLSIYWGGMDDAMGARFTEWETYPYHRSTSKESFSQVLFRALELPELRGEGASNITLHQLLRLMYVDQRTPHDQIFRSEPFDTILTRETVGNYLCGVYSARLYEAQLELKTVEVKLERSISDLRSIFVLLGKTGQGGANTSEFLRAEAASISDELVGLRDELAKLRISGEYRDQSKQPAAASALKTLRTELSAVQSQYVKSVDELEALELENADSKMFLSELERRLSALEDSQETRGYLGAVKFNFCPCCFSKVAERDDADSCTLCKTATQQGAADSQLLRMKNELALQQKESVNLYSVRAERIARLKTEIPLLRSQLRQSESAYRLEASSWIPGEERAAQEMSRRIGELNQKLAQIAEYQKLASVIEQLQEGRAALDAKRAELQDLIESIRSGEDNIKTRVSKAIFDALINLLRADLPRQEEFISAGVVDWGFGSNHVSVNAQTQFSESSMVVLKHCFHLALLSASCSISEMRFPRFLMLDGIEDGGQETARSHSLQRLIVKMSASLASSHQIIFATSQIAPDLDVESLVVGRTSTSQEKTLNIH